MSLLATWWTPSTWAHDDGPAWEQLPLREAAEEIFAPASGALFVRTDGGLVRSDDAGDTWSVVNLPAPGPYRAGVRSSYGAIAVDPLDHRTVYVSTYAGVFRTDDDAVSWRLVLPSTPEPRGLTPLARAIAVSPADPSLVYVAWVNSNLFRLSRSQDGGETWEEIVRDDLPADSLCAWRDFLLLAHPTDSDRVFHAAECISGRVMSVQLEESRTRGSTWGFTAQGASTPVREGYPSLLAVSPSAPPGRIYVGFNRDVRVGGGFLVRSDDDGATWRAVFQTERSSPASRETGQDVTLHGLVNDPGSADHLWLALNTRLGTGPVSGQVISSLDGGDTWEDIGGQLPSIADLALGVDGQNLYAATDQGIFRLRLPT